MQYLVHLLPFIPGIGSTQSRAVTIVAGETLGDDLATIFAIGNHHGDQPWEGRSISVGDVIETLDGELWLVAPNGFTEITARFFESLKAKSLFARHEACWALQAA